MRILRVIASVNPALGGPVEAARRFDEILLEKGHEVCLVCLDDPLSTYIESYPAPTVALGSSLGGYSYSPALVSWLRANSQHFDAVLVDGLWQYHSFAVWRALSDSSAPYFIFTHGMLDSWFKHMYPLKHLKKCLYWPWAEYRVLRDAKAVVYASEYERTASRESFSLYSANERIVALGTSSPPSISEVEIRKFYQKFPECLQKRAILFLGRIHPVKGCDLLIEAFARVAKEDKDVHLIMAGPDQIGWGSELQSRVRHLGLSDRITWTGMLEGHMKWAAFQVCEVFALPSHKESFGISVVEAMACGKPVIISDKVNIWREINEDNAGWVGDDSVEGCVESLTKWKAASPDQLMVIGNAAKAAFNKRFHIESAVNALLQMLNEFVVPSSRDVVLD